MAKTTTQNGGTVRKEMEQLFGLVPQFFEALPERAHDHEWAVFRDFQLGETALDNKTKQLIGLALAAEIKCKYCIYFHGAAARAMGASDEELKEACFMGGHTVQFSNALSGMQVDFDRFKQDVDRALQFMAKNQEAAPAQH
jgi:AhpD family alkylhydroperoxidase